MINLIKVLRMDKEKTLASIQNARRAHEAQMSKIKATINGERVENPTAVSKTKCDFGIWLYDDENHLRNILGSLFYDNMEVLHGKWHSEYLRIFEIFFQEQKKVFLQKYLGQLRLVKWN